MLRRRLRWGFRVAAGLSLLLFLLAAMACIRGQSLKDEWIWCGHPTAVADGTAKDGTPVWRFVMVEVRVALGRDGFVWTHWDCSRCGNSPEDRRLTLTMGPSFSHNLRPPRIVSDASGQATSYRRWWRRVGPDWERLKPAPLELVYAGVVTGSTADGLSISIPHWWLLAGTAMLPGLWLRRWGRARWWARVGCCPHCGYDLRASKNHCPECGTPITK